MVVARIGSVLRPDSGLLVLTNRRRDYVPYSCTTGGVLAVTTPAPLSDLMAMIKKYRRIKPGRLTRMFRAASRPLVCVAQARYASGCLLIVWVCAALFLLSGTAHAEEPPSSAEAAPSPPACEGLLPVPDYGGCWTRRPLLSGDWGGRRTRLARRGVTLRADWVQVAQGVVDGGSGERWAHTTNLDLYAAFDLARMGISPGGLVSARAQSRFGNTVNGDSGLLLPVHTYGYFPYTAVLDEDVPLALTEFNWLQMLSDEFGILLGKITTMSVANEFASGEGRTQFMNFQFIFPSVFAQIAPYSTLAAGIVWAPSPRVAVTSLLLNLEDASTGTGFDDFEKGQTWWTNVDLNYRVRGLPGGVTLGAGYAFNADFTVIGGLNLDPGVVASIKTKSDTWAVFASAWQYLVSFEPVRDIDPSNGRQDLRGLGAFAILGVGDESANPVQWSIAGGLSGRGLIPGRCNDTCGVGYFFNRRGDPLSGTALGRVLNGDSQGAEAYYRYAFTESIGVTVDAQWTGSGVRNVEDAFLLGVRLHVDF